MQASYNFWLVGLSILVAMVVAYTALKLAARVAEGGPLGRALWLLGGAAAMGMGIWSMHFIGMLAFSVEIPLRYGIFKTLLSLAIAMITSGFALAIASRPHLSLTRLAVGSVVMGAGICAMHYSGMAAIQIVPMITYQPLLVLASIAIAVGASFAALWLAFKLRSGQSTYIALARAGAAVDHGTGHQRHALHRDGGLEARASARIASAARPSTTTGSRRRSASSRSACSASR